MRKRKLTVNVVEGVRVGPDDHLVVSLPRDTTPEQFAALIEALKDNPLHGRILFIGGAESMAVVEGPRPDVC